MIGQYSSNEFAISCCHSDMAPMSCYDTWVYYPINFSMFMKRLERKGEMGFAHETGLSGIVSSRTATRIKSDPQAIDIIGKKPFSLMKHPFYAKCCTYSPKLWCEIS